MRKMLSKWAKTEYTWLIELLCLLIITSPAFFNLLKPGYFSMHDDQHIVRLYLLDQGIRQGQLYPRWVGGLGFGYGYPLYNFYPPLIYYIAELFHLSGFSLIWSIKLMIMTGYLLAAWGMYAYTKRLLGRAPALLASVIYTFFLYHTITVYVRGALAEFFSFAILPFIFLSLHQLAHKVTLKNSLGFGVALALLIVCHPLIAFPAMFFMAFAGIFYLITTQQSKIRYIVGTVAGGVWGLGLSAFFWLPSLAERHYTLVDDILTTELASYKIHYVFPSQFWYWAWGFGGSGAGLNDGISFMLGKIPILLSLLTISAAGFVIWKRRWSRQLSYIIFLTVTTLFALWMTTAYAAVIWDNVKFLWYLQFPWRFLTFVAVFMSLLAAAWLVYLEKMPLLQYALALGLALATIIVYQKYDQPQYYRAVTDADLTTRDEVSWRTSRSSFEFIPKGVVTTKSDLDTSIPAITKDSLPTQAASADVPVEVNKNTFVEQIFSMHALSSTSLQVNTFAFPGWTAYLSPLSQPQSERIVPIDNQNRLRLITLQISPGDWRVRLRFENTPVRTTANWLTVLALGLIITMLAIERLGYLRRQSL